MNFKKFTVLVVSTLLTIALAGCGATTKEANPANTSANTPAASSSPQGIKIAVAAVNDYPPFDYKKDGKLTGFDIELLEAIAKKEKIEVDWKEMKFDGFIPALQAKQIDAAISVITIREDRQKVVDFTDPYFESGLSMVVKKDSAIQKLEDLKGKTIVVKQGSTPLTKAKELAAKYGANVKILQDETSIYLDLETGNSDLTINDYPAVAYKLKVDGDKSKLRIFGDKLTAENYGIAVAKGNKELVGMLNKGLAELKKTGEFQSLFDKYFSTK